MKISNFKLAIGVPCTFPYIPISFFNSFVMMKKPEFVFIPADNGPIDTLRNDIVEIALKEGATHLLMMDVDQVYHEDTIPALLDRKKDVVGAMVCRRYPPFDPVMMRLGDEGYESIPTSEADETGLVEVDATGTGCLMFDMQVFKDLPYPWFKFQKDPATGLAIGEDIGLCQDLKSNGYRVFVDTTVPAGHLTTLVVNESTHNLFMAVNNKNAMREALQTVKAT